jgi:signal transduction histidine kinase
VIGKIDMLREFPKELRYTCVSENLSQVWKNLFFNAIQAMYTTDKKLEIRMENREKLREEWKTFKASSIIEDSLFHKEPPGGWILVSITDSGVGIPTELQEKMFSPFFTTKSLGEGIGLGLYVTKKIIHDHGGALFYKSEEGRTEFVVALPGN